MLYMSSPSAPAASFWRLPSSSAWRFSALAATSPASLRPDHHHAVVIGNHGVAGIDVDPGAYHGNVDGAERRLDRPLGRNRLRPHRKAHLAQRFHVAAPGVDDQADDAARLQRGREQIAEHAVGIVGGAADHQDVARPALLDRDMDHPVVAGMRQHGDGGARRFAARPYRAQIGFHQADAAIGLVHGGGAERAEPLDQRGIGSLDVADNNRLHASSSIAIGNSR